MKQIIRFSAYLIQIADHFLGIIRNSLPDYICMIHFLS